MTRAEIAALTRRVDSQDETLRAVADTVVDVREIVDGHTATLTGHTATLAEHTRLHGQHAATLAEHTRLHGQHAATLAEHTRLHGQHAATLAEHTAMLREILRRLPPAS